MSNPRDPAGRRVIRDANESVAAVAYRLSEVIAIYPITPASAMAEHCDEWAAGRHPNLWGAVPDVVQLQSEAGAAGAVHGALQAGALATTFTASQGLLLMIPTLYKLAGELTPCVIHVAARALATQALSIFGDHQDVMACRPTGAALLAAGTVQEAQDFAAIAHAASLETRLPFLHFFDGFRVSHEITDHLPIPDDVLGALIDPRALAAHRARALSPEHPVVRGTAQNPDTYFQAREAVNPFYAKAPGVVQAVMDRFAKLTGRAYKLVEYEGHPQAERVIVAMGAGAETATVAAAELNRRGERTGVIRIRLYRPFDIAALQAALPPTVRAIAALDRTKEPGAPGEPLYLDLAAALAGRAAPDGAPVRVVGGRFGLASKEFTPAMASAVFANLAQRIPAHGFTVGIEDDVSGSSLPFDPGFLHEPVDCYRAVFYGLGSDGTVSSNKSSIKILGAESGRHVQAYFVYDSKKAGAVTVSHLRLSPRPLRAPWLISEAQFVACHYPGLLERRSVTAIAASGATVLLNLPGDPAFAWERLPAPFRRDVRVKGLKVYAVDAAKVAQEAGLGRRISTVMQTCFFALNDLVDHGLAVGLIKQAARKAYGRKGPEVVAKNEAAIDSAVRAMYEIVPPAADREETPEAAADGALPEFVRSITLPLLAGRGDSLPVSALPVDGTWPSGTARHEKRAIATQVPVWAADLCIQCNKCAFVCPHAAIRPYLLDPAAPAGAPAGFTTLDYKGTEFAGRKYAIQVAPDDCTGCDLCVHACPAVDKSDPTRKSINMVDVEKVRERERANYAFAEAQPRADREKAKRDVKGSQFLQPLFEFSGACAGCGETPYLKLLSQLFGDRALVANATGCSSIYGGNLPTTPWACGEDGRGPAWANSLFEDNAEFGLGFRLAIDAQKRLAEGLLQALAPMLPSVLVDDLMGADQTAESGVFRQRERVHALRALLKEMNDPTARALEGVADSLIRRSVWIVGGDGWAYDIGFGGLDHVLAAERDVNVLVLDTEGYSNTGGQRSKATPLGAAARFATGGKRTAKKDLGLHAISDGNCYVASVAFGARDAQTVQAFTEAESFEGPSLIIACCPCISHGYDLGDGLEHQRLAVACGVWPLYRFDPRRAAAGLPPLQLDGGPLKAGVSDYLLNEERFRQVARDHPEFFAQVVARTAAGVRRVRARHEALARGGAPSA